MPRMSDISTDTQRTLLRELSCPVFDNTAFTGRQVLKNAKVALVSSAGLMSRTDENIHGGMVEYRTIDESTPDDSLLINHVSVNFDRTGFAEDANVVLPRQRLQELANDGVIAEVCDEAYSFMGATAPEKMEPHARRLAAHLLEKGIDTACLLPV